MRAEKLIGMTVYDTNGDKVGEVRDILFNENGQATGVVLSVGGVLRLGAKSVGLQWSEVDIQPDAEVAKIQSEQGSARGGAGLQDPGSPEGRIRHSADAAPADRAGSGPGSGRHD